MSKSIFEYMESGTCYALPGDIAADILRAESQSHTPAQLQAFEEELKRIGSPPWHDVDAYARKRLLQFYLDNAKKKR